MKMGISGTRFSPSSKGGVAVSLQSYPGAPYYMLICSGYKLILNGKMLVIGT
jgi:hypothetical protein